ncbi:MAG: HIT family protein [Burkholderiaceae bacterium]|nr:HIT family protein [Burkholderiaceae bacterium]
MKLGCPFCSLPASRVAGENEHALWTLDAYPISPGHSLVVPKRHIASFFEATANERAAILALIDEAKERTSAEHRPDGYNIGINDGEAAGQTVAHLHVHLIPRYAGDVADPRGGLRWVIPERADYWSNRDPER